MVLVRSFTTGLATGQVAVGRTPTRGGTLADGAAIDDRVAWVAHEVRRSVAGLLYLVEISPGPALPWRQVVAEQHD